MQAISLKKATVVPECSRQLQYPKCNSGQCVEFPVDIGSELHSPSISSASTMTLISAQQLTRTDLVFGNGSLWKPVKIQALDWYWKNYSAWTANFPIIFCCKYLSVSVFFLKWSPLRPNQGQTPLLSPFVCLAALISPKEKDRKTSHKIEWREKTERSGRSHRWDNHPTDLFYLVPPHGRAFVLSFPRYTQHALCWCLHKRHSVIALTLLCGSICMYSACACICVDKETNILHCLPLTHSVSLPCFIAAVACLPGNNGERERGWNRKRFCKFESFDSEELIPEQHRDVSLHLR